MKAIDAATAHFKACSVQRLEIPEWKIDGKPLTVYWTPLTSGEMTRAMGDDGLTPDNRVALVVEKALDADGKRLFSIEDKPRLKRAASSHILMRIALAMLDAPTVEDMAKN